LPGSILAAIDADRCDASTIAYAVTRARNARANLTVICVWRPTWLLGFTAVAGCDPEELLKSHEQEAVRWFRNCLGEVPSDIYLRTLLVKGLLVRHLIKELRVTHHDELILSHRLGSRDVSRVRRVAPGLRVVVL
jgi:hypothetical protein